MEPHLKVISSNGKLITSLYSKPADCQQYLHYGSCHPEHAKRSIVYSQALKIKTVRSQESDLNENSLNLRSWFNVDNKRSNKRQKKGILFVVTFHPKLKVLQNINKHLYLVYMNDEVKSIFTPKPMFSFRSSCKISS